MDSPCTKLFEFIFQASSIFIIFCFEEYLFAQYYQPLIAPLHCQESSNYKIKMFDDDQENVIIGSQQKSNLVRHYLNFKTVRWTNDGLV